MASVRILGGKKAGRSIEIPDWAKPASTPIRSYIFDKLGSKTQGSKVADLYAGGGTSGIEALSRGAARAVFVDYELEAKQVILKNLHTLGLNSSKVESMLVRDFIIKTSEKFDLVFIDPPFPTSNNPALATVHKILADKGVVILRRVKSHPMPPVGSYLQTLHTHAFNGDEVIFLDRK